MGSLITFLASILAIAALVFAVAIPVWITVLLVRRVKKSMLADLQAAALPPLAEH